MIMADGKENDAGSGDRVLVVIAWILVGVPLGWGIYQTLVQALVLFQ